MRILHLMLSNFYIDNAAYQENIIPYINKKNGHDVMIIASTEVFTDNNILGYTNPSSYVNEYGIPVIRLPYKHIITDFISRKIRDYHGLLEQVESFNPNIILFHGAAAYAIATIAKYKNNNPQVKFLVDSHEDINNSARNFLSKWGLHKLFYRRILQNNLKYIDKILYITKETYHFLKEIYNVPDEKLHFFPLGGIVPKDSERLLYRQQIREEFGLNDDDIICIHSGKLDKLKRTTEILRGFSAFKENKFKLFLIGSVNKEIQEEINKFSDNDRIRFLGWMDSNRLQQFLMAGDLYIQLGSQSATMQQALCNGCAVAVFPYESHMFLLQENAYYIRSAEDITYLLEQIALNPSNFNLKRNNSFNFAKEVLDYNIISNIIVTDI